MLTAEQVAQFQRDGYLNGGQVLSDEEVEVLRGELKRVIENHDRLERKPVLFRNLNGNAETPVWQIVNMWEASDPFAALMKHPKIAEEIAQLTGASELRIWHDQIQFKPAETGGVFARPAQLISSTGGKRRRRRRAGSGRLRSLAGRLRHHGQLQHGGALPLAEQRHQHMAAVRKLDRIMVAVGHVPVDLAELADAEIDLAGPDPAIVVSHVLGEGEFGALQQADRDIGFAYRGETARRGAGKRRGDQRLSDLGRARRNSVQTVVTHRIAPRSR